MNDSIKVSIKSINPVERIASFVVEYNDPENMDHNGDYHVRVFLSENGKKFVDEQVFAPNERELELEGTDGEIHEKIMDFVDKNWDTLYSL